MNITTIKSALVSGVLMGTLSIILAIVQAQTIFGLDWHELVNAGVLGFLTAIVSIVKTTGTTVGGKFAGIKIK